MTSSKKNCNPRAGGNATEQSDPQQANRRLHNPHDALFSALLSDGERAGAFIRDHLPSRIISQLADTPPEIVETDFLDKGLCRSFADLLLKCETISADPNFLLILGEHKSRPDAWMLEQLLLYLSRVCARFPRSERARVIVMVAYTGEESWNGPTNFCELFGYERPDVLNFVPNWPIVFLNLRKMPVEQLSRLATLKIGWAILTGRAQDHLEILSELGPTVCNWPLREQLIRYTYSEYEASIAEIVRGRLLLEGSNEEAAKMVTMEEKLRAEGREEGRVKCSADLTAKLLERRFGPLPRTVRRQISDASLDQLDVWFRRAIDAESMDAVLGRS